MKIFFTDFTVYKTNEIIIFQIIITYYILLEASNEKKHRHFIPIIYF